jgi:plasmid stabilization system protein ParE
MASVPVIIGARTQRQIAAADRWWKKNRESSDAIAEQIDWIKGLLALNPYMGQVAENTRRPGLRRLCLGRVDYHLCCRVDERRGHIEIVALRHARRRPSRID